MFQSTFSESGNSVKLAYLSGSPEASAFGRLAPSGRRRCLPACFRWRSGVGTADQSYAFMVNGLPCMVVGTEGESLFVVRGVSK
jgi:hypothetical protein